MTDVKFPQWSVKVLQINVCMLVSFTSPLFFHFADPSTTTDAGCSENDVRLVNNNRFDLLDGRVEVCINRAWGTVCSELFDTNEARVVCGSFNGYGGCTQNCFCRSRKQLKGVTSG